MTGRGKRSLAASAMAVIALLGVLWSQCRGDAPVPATVGTVPALAGTRLRYHVSLENHHAASVALGDGPAQRVTADSSLEGELVATIESADDGGYLVAWRIASVEGGDFALEGKPQIRSPETLARHLVGPELVTEHDPSGRLVRLHRAPTANQLFTGTAELLAVETAFSRPLEPASTWTATEESQLGPVETTYRAFRNGAGIRIERERRRYLALRGILWAGDPAELGQEIDGSAAIELAADGVMTRFAGTDEIQLTGPGGADLTRVRQSITLELIAVEKAPVRQRAAVVTGRAPAAVGSLPPSEEFERRALAQQVGDLTWPSLREHILDHSGAIGSSIHDVMWRGVALLRLHPELCREMPALLSGDDVSLDSRMLAFSILAGAGTAVAQEVMVEMLRSSWVEADPVAHRRLLQQFSFVARPSRAAADYVLDQYRQRQDDVHMAAAYTLGSMARRAREVGEATLSAELESALVAGLGDTDAADAGEVAGHIMSLGNTGNPEHVSVMESYVTHESPKVRAAVARSLRHTPTKRAQKLLLSLSADRSGRVSRRAIHTLHRLDASPKSTEGLAELLGAGRVPPSAYASALPLVRRVADPALRRRALTYMLATAPLDGRLLAQLRTSLRRSP